MHRNKIPLELGDLDALFWRMVIIASSLSHAMKCLFPDSCLTELALRRNLNPVSGDNTANPQMPLQPVAGQVSPSIFCNILQLDSPALRLGDRL